MRKLTLTALLATVCACGSTNPAFWEKCEGSPCHTDGTSQWDIWADGGNVEGSHDFVGPADPYVCLTIDGDTECSSHVSDSDYPRWRDQLFSNIPASRFVGKTLAVSYWDKDTDTLLDKNDSLCKGSIIIDVADLEEGGVRYDCAEGDLTFTFHFVR
jgi:hypothetical protein